MELRMARPFSLVFHEVNTPVTGQGGPMFGRRVGSMFRRPGGSMSTTVLECSTDNFQRLNRHICRQSFQFQGFFFAGKVNR
jgi:hypothetical protein